MVYLVQYVENVVTSWLRAYKIWVGSQPTYAAYITSDGYFDGSTSATAQAAFYDSVSTFLAHPQLGRFNADVVWKDGDPATRVIVATRSFNVIKNVGTSAEQLSAMRDITGRATSANVAGSFAFSPNFVMWTVSWWSALRLHYRTWIRSQAKLTLCLWRLCV